MEETTIKEICWKTFWTTWVQSNLRDLHPAAWRLSAALTWEDSTTTEVLHLSQLIPLQRLPILSLQFLLLRQRLLPTVASQRVRILLMTMRSTSVRRLTAHPIPPLILSTWRRRLPHHNKRNHKHNHNLSNKRFTSPRRPLMDLPTIPAAPKQSAKYGSSYGSRPGQSPTSVSSSAQPNFFQSTPPPQQSQQPSATFNVAQSQLGTSKQLQPLRSTTDSTTSLSTTPSSESLRSTTSTTVRTTTTALLT